MRKIERDFFQRSARSLWGHDPRRSRRVLRGIRRIFRCRGVRLTEMRRHFGGDAIAFFGEKQGGLREGTYITAHEWTEWRGVPSRMIACAKQHLLVFGEKTIEPWQDAGAPNFPYQIVPGTVIERGLLAPYATAKADNTVFFLGEQVLA